MLVFLALHGYGWRGRGCVKHAVGLAQWASWADRSDKQILIFQGLGLCLTFCCGLSIGTGLLSAALGKALMERLRR